MIRLVDIFSGCGGLSLGFDLHDGQTAFRTCLAIDNEPSATRIFNSNFGRVHPKYGAEIARTADVCWFENADEIRLFYLSHIAKLEGLQELRSRLLQLGFGRALAEVRRLDAEFETKFAAICAQPAYAAAAAKVDQGTHSLASVKKLLRTLGIRSVSRPVPDYRCLPWSEEAADRFWGVGEVAKRERTPRVDCSYGVGLWLDATAAIRSGSQKQGRGQHTGNAARYASLLAFLESQWGKQVEQTIVEWRSRRAQSIQEFLVSGAPEVEAIYLRDFRVGGLLGGPPCKGFSRIGRPVANSLRDQGVFAWTSDEYGDERNRLVLHYVMFLEALKPLFFVFENVSNFQSSLKTPDGEIKADHILAEAVADLSFGRLSYDVSAKQITANRFAVPQTRIRYIMFGVNREFSEIEASDFFKLDECDRDVTVSEAFYGLPRPLEFAASNAVDTSAVACCAIVVPPRSDGAMCAYFEWIQRGVSSDPGLTDAHIFRRMRDDDAAFFQFVGPGIRWMDWELRSSPTLKAIKRALSSNATLAPLVEGNLALRLILEETLARYGLQEQHLLQASYLKNRSGVHGDWLERLAGDRPSKTVVAHIGRDTYGYIHPSETRPITIREAARLQSFPDGFSFAGVGVVDAYIAVGNAVPPLLSYAFARRIAALMFDRIGHERKVPIGTRQRA